MYEWLVCTLCYTYGCHLNKSKLLPAIFKYGKVHIPSILDFLLITTNAVAQPHTVVVLAKHGMMDSGMEKNKSEAQFVSLKLIQSLIQGPSCSVNVATYWLSRG